jgi:hypothetical protein
MTNLKEKLIKRIESDPRVRNALDMKNKDNIQSQKNCIKAYEEVIARLCEELENPSG